MSEFAWGCFPTHLRPLSRAELVVNESKARDVTIGFCLTTQPVLLELRTESVLRSGEQHIAREYKGYTYLGSFCPY